jgi:hypothetical protein
LEPRFGFEPEYTFGSGRTPRPGWVPKEVAMLDVFRFAWFAVRTFLGIIALTLVAYGALWVFVRIDSTAMRNEDPNAALNRVKSFNALRVHPEGGRAISVSPAVRDDCGTVRIAPCDRH